MMPARRYGLPVLPVLLGLWLLLPVPGAAAWFTDRSGDRLRETQGSYVLSRPLQDYYDSAFILTRAAHAAPRSVGITELAAALLHYDVVFYGELHAHPGVHLQQMQLLRALYAREPRLVLSLEQFERDVQPIVDDYLAGRIGESTLIDQARAWDNYRTSYRPLLSFAQAHHLPVIAAEAPDWAIQCIGQWGAQIIDQFSPLERSWVAQELHLAPGAYRDKYLQFQGSSATHGGGGAPTPQAQLRAQRSFTAQVARDDTMAESIERALQRYPGYKVLHLTGSFHVEDFLGSVERLQWREPQLKIAVIVPIEVSDPAAPSFTAAQLAQGTALQLVYPDPPSFAEGEDQSAWVAKIMARRAAERCKYSLPEASP
jgi:uncharacterized iron-regulated protein